MKSPQKKTPKPTQRIPSLYRKIYSEKNFAKKISRRLHVPQDREWITSLFDTLTDEKGGVNRVLRTDLSFEKKDLSRLKAIASQIKAQRGRFNIPAFLIAAGFTVGIFLLTVVFRNQIIHSVLTSAIEGMVGARCEIESVDLNIFEARFTAGPIRIANRNNPMTNLIEAEKIEISFNMLELTRGRLIAENMETTGIRRNTERRVSGALSARKEKAFVQKQAQSNQQKTNPVSAALNKKLEDARSEITPDAGIEAVKNQLDPVAFWQREQENLRSPQVVQNLKDTLPDLTTKWQQRSNELATVTARASNSTDRLRTIQPASIRTIPEIQAALTEIQTATGVVKQAIDATTLAAREVQTDSTRVATLGRSVADSLAADSRRVGELAGAISSINLASGQRLIAGLFETFMLNTLNDFYPAFEQGLATIKNMQTSDKKPVKEKQGPLARMEGRTILFGDSGLPTFLLKNGRMSGSDTDFAVNLAITDLTTDADRLGRPALVDIQLERGTVAERAQLVLDLRSDATDTATMSFTGTGYPLALPSGGIPGVPAISGSLRATGEAAVQKDGSVRLNTDLVVSPVKAELTSFEPSFLYQVYRDTLNNLERIDLIVQGTVELPSDVTLSVSTDVDNQIARALQSQINRQVEAFKSDVRRQGHAYLEDLRSQYTNEMAEFNRTVSQINRYRDQAQTFQQELDTKKKQLEDRLAGLVRQQAAPAADAVRRATEGLRRLPGQ